MKIFLAMAFVTLVSLNAFANAEFKCDSENWVGSHGLGSDDVFQGTLQSNCVITNATSGGLAGLAEHLQAKIVSGNNTVNAGPDSETYENLPGVKFDITASDPSAKTEIRSDVHIATDSRDALQYANFSKEVKGSGNSQFLRKLDILFHVTATEVPGTYNLTLSVALAVKRPWYAPANAFVPRAEQSSHENFLKNRDGLLPDLANSL